MTLDPKRAYLDARDARQDTLLRVLAQAHPQARGCRSMVAISANVPGPRKHRPGVTRLVRAGVLAVQEALELEVLFEGSDLLGPFVIGGSPRPPRAAKVLAVAVETATPAGRLLDIGVYDPGGTQADRSALGLPARSCYCCGEAAGVCMRLQRHSAAELEARVDTLLAPYRPLWSPLAPEAFAQQLVRGAQRELELTPKPGLVDRHDSGSHADLSLARMETSIRLLPLFYGDLLRCASQGSPFQAMVEAGIEAETRMQVAIQSNAHKGYLFLSGLALLAACSGDHGQEGLRQGIAALATGFFGRFAPQATHGAELRASLALGGIQAEAVQGLPAVFEAGWPAYQEALEAGWGDERAGYYLMAILMQRVEDTTTIRRGGLEALERLRRDGAALQRMLEQGREARAWLVELNTDYSRLGLNMGGVADCMALTFELQGSAGSN